MQDENNNPKDGENFNNFHMGEKNSFVNPKKIIDLAGIKSGEKVADFGCGAGYFSIPASTVVGEEGEVYAFDVLPSAIEALESQAKTNGIDNITIKRVNLEKERGTGLEDGSMDWVIIKDILFQNKEKKNILKEAKRILKDRGNILVMEWNENLVIGPEKKSRITSKELVEIIFTEGFVFKNQSDAGDYHYVIIATKM